jgi:hypothetical protein
MMVLLFWMSYSARKRQTGKAEQDIQNRSVMIRFQDRIARTGVGRIGVPAQDC